MVPAPKTRRTAPSSAPSAAASARGDKPGVSVTMPTDRPMSKRRAGGAGGGARSPAGAKAAASWESSLETAPAGKTCPPKAKCRPGFAPRAVSIASARLPSASLPGKPSGCIEPVRTTARPCPAPAASNAAPVKAIVSVPWVTITGPGAAAMRSKSAFQIAGPKSALSISGSSFWWSSVSPGAICASAAATFSGAGRRPFGPAVMQMVPPVSIRVRCIGAFQPP